MRNRIIKDMGCSFLTIACLFAFTGNVDAAQVTNRLYCKNNTIYDRALTEANIKTSGSGWTWNSETAKLTLNNLDLLVTDNNGVQFTSSCGVGDKKVITIELAANSTNTIKAKKGEYSGGIGLNGANEIKIVGSTNSVLNIISDNKNAVQNGALNIENAKVNVTGYTSGVASLGYLHLTNATLNINTTKTSNTTGYNKNAATVKDIWKNSTVSINTQTSPSTGDVGILGNTNLSVIDISSGDNTININSTLEKDKIVLRESANQYKLYSNSSANSFVYDDTMKSIPLDKSETHLIITKGILSGYRYGAKTLTNKGTITLKSGSTLSIPASSTLKNDGTIILESGSTFNNLGSVINKGTLTINAESATNTGIIDNTGTINGSNTIEETKYLEIYCEKDHVYNGVAPKCTVKDRKTGTDYTSYVKIKYAKALRYEMSEPKHVVYSDLFDTAPTDVIKYILANNAYYLVTNQYYAAIDFTNLVNHLGITNFLTNGTSDTNNPGYYKYFFNIIPKELKLDFNRFNKFNGSGININPTLTGAITGDDVSVVLSGDTRKAEKGYYTFTATLDGADKYNYTLDTNYDWWIDEEKEVVKTNPTTNIILEATSKEIPSGAELTVTELTSGDDYNIAVEAIGDSATKLKLFDITLLKDTLEVQPNGYITIKMPIPDGFDKTKLWIYHIDDDGNKTVIDYRIDGNYIVFKTNHLSSYALVEGDTNTSHTVPSILNPQTADGIIFYSLLAVLSAGAFVLAYKKNLVFKTR